MAQTLHAGEEIIERARDLPENIVLSERDTGVIVSIGDADMSVQNLLDADFQLLFTLGVGQLSSMH